MKIGELAKQTNISVDTIRYYEKRQLLLDPVRTGSGYRCYSQEDLKRLLFIIQAKKLGFTLEEVKELLCLRSGKDDCVQVQKIAKLKSQEIKSRIEKLSQIAIVLDYLSHQCTQKNNNACPILESLEHMNE